MATINRFKDAGTIDVREVMARVEELEESRSDCASPSRVLTDPDNPQDLLGGDWWEDENREDAEELSTLTALLDDLAGNWGDEQWRGDWYPVTLVSDSNFEDYAKELAEDIGAINRDAKWPNDHIDWTAAAEALQQDYAQTDFEGTTYWYR